MFKFSRPLRTTALLACLSSPLFAQVIEPPNVRDTARFRFLVAGHAYGSHRGDNLGLHPPLVAKLHAGAFGKLDFIVFTGDVLRRFEQESLIY